MDSNAAGNASWKGEVDLPKGVVESWAACWATARRGFGVYALRFAPLCCAVLRCAVLSKGELFGPSVTG
jgi:hypothetical protein